MPVATEYCIDGHAPQVFHVKHLIVNRCDQYIIFYKSFIIKYLMIL